MKDCFLNGHRFNIETLGFYYGKILFLFHMLARVRIFSVSKGSGVQSLLNKCLFFIKFKQKFIDKNKKKLAQLIGGLNLKI